MRCRCLKYGNDISTDLIIAGKYTKTLNMDDLGRHALEDLDPEFHQKKGEGDCFLVAGSYFGCGSSREQAPVALKVAGVKCVVAKSFSRIFYRNAVNIGLPIVECDTDGIDDGDELEYTLGADTIVNCTKGCKIAVTPLPAVMLEILKAGGIEGFFAKGGFDRIAAANAR